MDEEIQFYLEDTKDQMDKAIDWINTTFTQIRAGKVSTTMLDGIMVDCYGAPTPFNQVASVTTPDARSVAIKPWDKNLLAEIEKAIVDSDLGLTPQNDGELIRLNIPPLTEERRADLVKKARSEGENGKVSIRNIRKDTNDILKKAQKDGASEDAIKTAEAKVQVMTDENIKKVDEILKLKEDDIMTI